jgi:hypothetical protein
MRSITFVPARRVIASCSRFEFARKIGLKLTEPARDVERLTSHPYRIR